jgi:hypothetical protein
MIAKQTIQSTVRDRETSYPSLELEMRPLGTQLPRNEQTRELLLQIEGSLRVVLDEAGIAALREFLDIKP